MKVAIYARLSEEDRDKKQETDDSESIQNQKSMLIQYAIENGWEIYQIYSDDDYTGGDRNRPAFSQLIADAETKKFNIVLCKTQARFTRELELVERYIHDLFPRWGIRFIGIVDNADTTIKGNKKSRQINGLVNEWYLEDLSENIKSVLTDRRKKGLHIGAFALYGYQKNPERKGHLIIDEEAAQIVREVFTLFSQGYGKATIAKLLNERGIPNPTEYKRKKNLRHKPPKRKNSTLWWYYTVASMLKNEIYIGNMVQGKYESISYKSKESKPRPKEKWIRVEGTHEAIIPIELWNKVQDMIQERFKPWSSGQIGIFAGKTRCMNCGGSMQTSKNHGLYYLKCRMKGLDKNSCVGSFVPVKALEQTVLFELKELEQTLLDKDKIAEQVSFNNKIDEAIARKQAEIYEYEKRMVAHSKIVKDLYLDKVKGVLTNDDFIALSKDFSGDKNRIEQILSKAHESLVVLERKKQMACDRYSLIDEYLSIDSLSREHVERLVDVIFIGKRNPETKGLPIEIHWTF